MTDSRPLAFSWRMQAGLFGSAAAIALSGIAAMFFVGHGWSWPLFLWGVVTGPLIVGGLVLASEAGARAIVRAAGQPMDLRSLRRRRVRQYGSSYVGACCIGFTIGTISARLHTTWPDLLFTVYAVVGLLLVAVVYRIALRRAAAPRPN